MLDPADGIARVMGDRALYLRMLRCFHDDHQDAAARIRAAVDSGETRLAHRMAHTLQGASGMICARTVHRLAGTLDIALRGGTASPLAFAAIETALDELPLVIVLMLGAETTPPLTPRPARASEDRLEDQLMERLAAVTARRSAWSTSRARC